MHKLTAGIDGNHVTLNRAWYWNLVVPLKHTPEHLPLRQLLCNSQEYYGTYPNMHRIMSCTRIYCEIISANEEKVSGKI